MTNHGVAQKRRERAWVDLVRKCHRGVIPDGDVEQPSPPAADALIRSRDRPVSIEISECVPEENLLVRDAQRKALINAQTILEDGDYSQVFVDVRFNSGLLPPHRVVVNELLDVVKQHLPLDGESVQILSGTMESQGLPAWMAGISIFEPHRKDMHWIGGSVWSIDSVSRDQIESLIRRKERRLHGYRAATPSAHVWLMIVMDQSSVATERSIPFEAKGWRFHHSFERVLLANWHQCLSF